MTGDLEGQIRLDRRAHFDRAAGVEGPSAVLLLTLQDVTRGLDCDFVLPAPQPGQEQDVLGFEDRVPFEFPDPVAIRMLLIEQPPCRRLESRMQPRVGESHERWGRTGVLVHRELDTAANELTNSG